MNFYENIEAERERIQRCISKYGHTSDHNLDWYSDSIIEVEAEPVFVEFDDGTGLLTHRDSDKWRIWSDPLSQESDMADRIGEFAVGVFKDEKIKEVWCDDVSDKIYPELKKNQSLKLNDPYYHLFWPVLDMAKYNPALPGGHFKETRNAKNKFYREHKLDVVKTSDLSKENLLKIVDDWFKEVSKKQKEDVYDLRYRLLIKNNFRGFTTARVLVADGKPVGFNAGYEVVNRPGRFAGVIGIHDYSIKDLGTILWLEDLGWIKNSGYKELDMQGNEYEWELKQKTQFGAVIERKTDTFSITSL
ncbi:MAG: hypothetical protein A3B86_03315 [Candidatus Yanofskybacteria bacterium RIFCSPHIGHO2_02_FULL_38_22b]|uniref:Phosphatidylglycerol lysyltransferase C-terminal domain-containing protein n=1 Tax=Candidatus Yanofskybacteria bacterium RIFCSPHIGHO2_02_FULL_38_22b TaxID=1802673 RepID=A0A1F8F1D2_9BACT|nr:MAG: hypothetical protein A3B86_03315 [Candidatus Yanofskybacteria bacterium RIFCSPHIGHO2_02_FULL_38_22b]OGN19877.1 MAG: hypothetical protein A2910_01890 [Candidatus Yanofskybacteria bacterium RIFCSPLOWO2_01_FULL_39_28]